MAASVPADQAATLKAHPCKLASLARRGSRDEELDQMGMERLRSVR